MFKTLLKWLTLGAAASVAITGCVSFTPVAPPTATPLPPTATPILPTAAPTVQPTTAPGGPGSLFPPITAAEWQVGPASARVTIIEYSDFQ